MFKASVEITLASYDLIEFTDYSEFEPRLDQTPSVQSAGALRSDHARTFARGNVSNQVTFSRIKEHASRDAALDAMLTFAELWPKLSGSALIKTGTNPQGMNLLNASIDRVEARIVNYLTYHTITLIGGKLEAVAP